MILKISRRTEDMEEGFLRNIFKEISITDPKNSLTSKRLKKKSFRTILRV